MARAPKDENAGRIKPIFKMATTAFRVAPLQASIATFLYVLSAFARPLFAVFLGLLVHAAATDGSSERITVLAILLAATSGVNLIISELAWKVVTVVQERAAHELDRELITLVMSIPGIEHHERPEYLDKLERLRSEHWLLGQSVSVVLSSSSLVMQIVATIAVLASIEPLLLLLPLFAIPEAIASKHAEKIRVVGLEKLQSEWRKSDNALDLIVKAGPAKEVRVFGLGEEIMKRHDESSRISRDREFGDRWRGAWWIALGRLIFVVGFAGGIWFVASQVINGHGNAAELVTAASIGAALMGQMQWAAGQIAWLDWTLTAVNRYLWILGYGKSITAKGDTPSPQRLSSGIRFDHVAFSYPGTDRLVIEDLDVFLPAGSTVAIIGDNGAGKSTLIKLLTRMYEPTSGRILVDDISLSDIDPADWRQHTSAAFQDHAKFELIANEAVGVGDLNQANAPDVIDVAVESGGAAGVIESLPRGLDTQLGAQWDGGVDLSGGQWQKLALARGMMRDPLLLVLDEPTSALDAETEHALFERFARAAHSRSSDEGTITLLVSHRFSTVRMADLIIVVSGGVVAESGSHDELMQRNGLYAELYELQARAYR